MNRFFNSFFCSKSIVHDNVIEGVKCVEGEDTCLENAQMILKDFENMEAASSELFGLAEAMIDER